MSPFIILQNICFQHKLSVLLDNISLQILPHSFTTLIGPNGAGKTTLLKILLKLLSPHSGHVHHEKKISIGYVPQRFSFPKDIPLSVHDFILINQQPSLQLLDKVLSQTNIHDLMEKSVHCLSGGEIQQILFARTLLRNPKIIFLDEAAQNLDMKAQCRFYELINTLHREEHRSIFMISHDLHFLAHTSQHLICLNKKILIEGVASHVIASEIFRTTFGATVQHQALHFQWDTDTRSC